MKMNRDFKEKLTIFWKGWGFSILVAIVVATSFKSAIADWNIVPTGSMKPTIVEGDRIFVNKLAYDLKIPYTTRHIAKWANPRRGDIVVFLSPEDNKRLVKRVVGLPGDTIAMLNNILLVNGNPQTYEPLGLDGTGISTDTNTSIGDLFIENLEGRKHPVKMDANRIYLDTFAPVSIPPGNYFVMGDNRNNSADSRFFGFVERRQIVGRATAVVVSLNINDRYRPRWGRFFTKLP